MSDETDLSVPNQEGKQRKSGKPLLIPAKALNIETRYFASFEATSISEYRSDK